MKTLNLLVVCLLASGLAFGQKQDLKPFTAIDVFGPFEIELIKSDKEGIEMDLGKVDPEDITMEVRHGELELKFKNRYYLTDWESDKFSHQSYIKTKIYYHSLDEIQASAGALLTSSGPIRNKRVIVSGSMGCEVTLVIEAETIHTKSSMGAVINLEGQAEFLEVKASMGGLIKTTHLNTKSAYVKASMGSEVSIFASNEIDIEASMGSEVKYTGNPTVRHTTSKMGADIHTH